MDQIALNFLKTRLSEEQIALNQASIAMHARAYAVQVLEEEIVKIEGVKIPEPPPVTTEEPAPPVESEENDNAT